MRRAPVEAGTLYLVATPIGNLEDITYRAVRVLGEVDVLAAEDTRSARVLLDHYGVRQRPVSLFQGNESRRSGELLERLRQGASVALISEAGMPGISDPGAELVARCVAAGVPVEVVPGPSAALTALVLSGLPTDRFAFVGFLPRARRDRLRVLEQLRFEPGTLVLYEAPGRVGRTLEDLARALGPRPAALARELTKLHQEVRRGPLDWLAEQTRAAPPRGEVTLVVGPGDQSEDVPWTDIHDEIRSRLSRGESPRQIADALGAHGRRRVYQAALALRDGREQGS